MARAAPTANEGAVVRRLALVVPPLLFAACSAATPHSDAPGAATVVRPVDGDTVVVDVAGQHESLRLIGIDTPESVAEDRPVECYGPESKNRAAALLPEGTAILIQRDVEARDRYGRLLGYVTRVDDDTLVNRLLVEEGYAIARSYPPNTALDAELREAESGARGAGRGLWGACGGADRALTGATGR